MFIVMNCNRVMSSSRDRDSVLFYLLLLNVNGISHKYILLEKKTKRENFMQR